MAFLEVGWAGGVLPNCQARKIRGGVVWVGYARGFEPLKNKQWPFVPRSVTSIWTIVPGESPLRRFVWIREINGCSRTKDSSSSSSGIFQWWLAATVFGPCERMVLVL